MIAKKEELREIKKGETGHGLLIENDGFMSFASTKHNRQLKEEIDNNDGWYVPKPFIVDAVLQKFDTKNANGRIYPERILKKQVEAYQKLVDEKMALAELNHPSESTIDLGRISHNIIEMHWEGKTLVGKLELNITEGFRRFGICTTCGDQAAQLLLSGWKIGISSRGIGSVEQKLGQTIVGEDFELIGFDIVSTPSTPGAYLSIRNGEDLVQYIESDETKKEKNTLNEKLNKIEQILL